MIDPVTFIERTLVNPETDEPFVLLDSQREFLRRSSEVRANGHLCFAEQIYSCPKKSGKTTFAAMMLLYRVLTGGRFAEGYCVANDQEQAQSRVFAAAVRIVEASPSLMAEVDSITQLKITFKNGAFIQALASDYAGAAGSNPTITVFDELWAYVSERSHRLFDEMVPPPTRPLGCRLTVTYGGFENESDLLRKLYERAMAGEEVAKDFYVDGDLLAFWSHDFQAPWQTEEWREQMRAALRPNQYLRMIENRFTSSEDSFVPLEAWDACVYPDVYSIAIDQELPIWIGVDASTKRDHTVLVAVTWDADRKRVRVVWHRVFRPTPSDPIDFEMTVERDLLEAERRFSVRGVYFDPFQMANTAQRMMRRGVPMIEYPQTSDRLTACGENLRDLILSRTLVCYADEDFRRSIGQAIAVETPRGWRIGKSTRGHKIDLVVALAMACLGAIREGPSVPITPDMLGVIDDGSVSAQLAALAEQGFDPAAARQMVTPPERPWHRRSRGNPSQIFVV